tara:strand:+ start:1291 stop:1509 length:219 start_codon:yes stop_codon:yes gene_type:complete
MKLVTFEIFDGENSYNQYSIFETDMSKEEMIEEVYGDVRKGDHREYKVYSCQDITEKEASVLQKFHVAFLNL